MSEYWEISIAWYSGDYSSGSDYQFTVKGTAEEVEYLVDELNCKYEDFFNNGREYDMYVYNKAPTLIDIFNLSAEAIEKVAYEHVK